MKFIQFLRRESNSNSTKLVIIAVLSGLINILLVSIIISSAKITSPGKLNFQHFAMFIIALAGFIYCRNYSLTQISITTEHIIQKLRSRIINKVRKTNLLLFEKLGRSPIYTALSRDAFTLSEASTSMASTFSALVMLLGATFYIVFLSARAFQLTLACIAVGIFFYNIRRKKIEAQLQEASQKENEFFDLLNHLLNGFKEIKINSPRSEDLYENYILKSALETEALKVKTGREFARINIFSQCFFYVLIAVVIFILPSLSKDASAGVTMQVATIILFMIGPLGEVVGSTPIIMRGDIAVENIEKLEAALDVANVQEESFEVLSKPKTSAFKSIVCNQISYTYGSLNNGEGFMMGPLNLTVNCGEILFIVGGNGSGKSTMLKVLTGLYPHQSGTLHLDERIITQSNLPRYRSLFSTVFTDFHLFDRLYGMPDADPLVIEELIERMELQDKVSVQNGKFSTTNLSTGQRKRLALISALLEQRPILIFDEVAADQDPLFRKNFYEVQVKQLQKEGRTIVAVTHDDHYFHVADRVLKMEYGKLSPYKV